jgi:DNA-directed RNA polymerase subunit RPC12/RpoP
MTMDSFECATCGDQFKAYEDATAAEGPYCSPACESEGQGLD